MNARDIDVMARTVFGEARGESYQGKVAVAHVILNRVAKGGWWGKTPIEVCTAPRQFSCWNDGDPNRARMMKADLSDKAYQESLRAVLDAISGQDPTGGACHYHALSVAPKWAEGKQGHTIGNHLFFRGIA